MWTETIRREDAIRRAGIWYASQKRLRDGIELAQLNRDQANAILRLGGFKWRKQPVPGRDVFNGFAGFDRPSRTPIDHLRKGDEVWTLLGPDGDTAWAPDDLYIKSRLTDIIAHELAQVVLLGRKLAEAGE